MASSSYIRRKSDGQAKEIMDSSVGELEHFRKNWSPEDDITPVIIKFKAN
jgi:hypothetical protein